MWLTWGLFGLFVVLGIIFLSGHGASLIAGYNTATPEQRGRYDFRKLSRLMSIFSFGMAGMLGVCFWTDYTWQIGVPGMLGLIGLVLVGTRWCLKPGLKAKTSGLVWLGFYGVFVMVISFFLYSGDASMIYDASGVLLDATYTRSQVLFMQDIEEVFVDEDFKVGYKVGGVNNACVEAGRYHNKTYGDYRLYARTNAKGYLVFVTKTGIYVYGDHDLEALYEAKERIQEEIAS